MNLVVFFSVLVALKFICFGVSRRKVKRNESKEEYYLGGRSISLFPLAMTLVGAVLGGGSVLGSAEEAFKFGWSFLLYPLGFCLGFLLVGTGSGKKLRKLKISTVAQIFEVVYRSVVLKRLASLLSIFSLFLILVVQIVASKKFLIAIGFQNPLLFCSLWAVIFFHTVSGGFKAVVSSHVIQTVFFIIILFTALFCVTTFNPTVFSKSLSVGFSKSTEIDITKMLGWFLMPIFFFLISQDIGQRCFAAKSHKVVVGASLIAGVCMLVVMAIPVFFGNVATALNLLPKNGASILMTVLSRTTNPIITALVGSGFVAAVSSSAESLINATSSNVFNDFNLEKYLKRFDLAKGISLVISIAALVVAWMSNNIIDIVIVSYELLICTLFVSVFISFFKLQGNALSAFYSIITGGAALLYFRISSRPSPMGYQLICLTLSLFAFFLGELQVRYRKEKESKLAI